MPPLRSDAKYNPPSQALALPNHAEVNSGAASGSNKNSRASSPEPSGTAGHQMTLALSRRRRRSSSESDSVDPPARQRPRRDPPPYSSNEYYASKLLQENQHRSATRQIFSLGRSDDSTPAYMNPYSGDIFDYVGFPMALVFFDREPPEMAVLAEDASTSYEPQAGEEVRPITPGLHAEFSAASRDRIQPSDEDHARYEAFDARFHSILSDPRISWIHPNQNVRFRDVFDVEMCEFHAIEVPPDADWKIGTKAVVDCKGCGSRAPSLTKPGYTVLALGHWSGFDPETGKSMTPEGCLEKLKATLVAKGGDPERMETMLGGASMSAV